MALKNGIAGDPSLIQKIMIEHKAAVVERLDETRHPCKSKPRPGGIASQTTKQPRWKRMRRTMNKPF